MTDQELLIKIEQNTRRTADAMDELLGYVQLEYTSNPPSRESAPRTTSQPQDNGVRGTVDDKSVPGLSKAADVQQGTLLVVGSDWHLVNKVERTESVVHIHTYTGVIATHALDEWVPIITEFEEG